MHAFIHIFNLNEANVSTIYLKNYTRYCFNIIKTLTFICEFLQRFTEMEFLSIRIYVCACTHQHVHVTNFNTLV